MADRSLLALELRTKRGALTSYAFACGATERKGGLTLNLEHGVYYVRGFVGSRLIYEPFETLKEARRFLKTGSRK